MTKMSRVHILLTGPPAVGKTTLVKAVVEILKRDRLTVCGFYTEEVRRDGVRIGFDVVTMDDRRAPLARSTSDNTSHQHGRQPQIGKYVVNVKSFEDISLSALELPTSLSSNEKVVMVVDEVGKMEVLSKPFQIAIQGLFCRPNCIVLATIPLSKGPTTIPLVQSLRSRNDTKVYEVSRENRDSFVQELVCAIKNFAMTP